MLVDDSNNIIEKAKKKFLLEYSSKLETKEQQLAELAEEKKDAENELKMYKEDTNFKLQMVNQLEVEVNSLKK